MPSTSANLRGIVLTLLSSLAFIVNDMLTKISSAHLPAGQILVMRGVVAMAAMVLIVWASGSYRQWRLVVNRFVVWRTIGEVGATVLYIYALFNMPIANISAINQIVPLMTTAAAAMFLGEAVDWRRWLAIAIGFAGVMIIMRPGVDGFDVYSVAALGSMAFIAMRDLVTRKFNPGISTTLVIAVTATAVLLTGVSMATVETWVPPTARDWLALSGAAALLLVGYGAVILAMRNGSLAVIAPFRYSVILFAIIIGFLVWGDVPDRYTIIGTAIVVATGIYSFRRDWRTARLLRAEAGISRPSA